MYINIEPRPKIIIGAIYIFPPNNFIIKVDTAIIMVIEEINFFDAL